jgi:hypothetical protein
MMRIQALVVNCVVADIRTSGGVRSKPFTPSYLAPTEQERPDALFD